MKKIGFILLMICSGLVFGQMRAVSQKIQELKTAKKEFTSYSLFSKNTNSQKTAKYLNSATDVTVLNMNSNVLNKIMDEAPELLSMEVPYMNETVEVVLYKQNVLTDTFKATDESGNVLTYNPGEYYRGIVNGDVNSIVAISFFDNEVMGVISTSDKGNINLGKSIDNQDYITYSDRNLLGENPFVCGADELDYNRQIEEQMAFDPAAQFAPTTTNCVKIYYEIAYKPYQQKGANIQATLDWITGIQNNIGTLYSNDNINMALNQVRIWTYQDPYTGEFDENLYEFQETVKDFDADLAHLVNYPSTTSVAFLDSICGDYNYAYSGISMAYSQVPTYSWTIMAMTHEMGHALGSPHTHACNWNGNNTAIDGCGPSAGFDEGCSGPIPSGGGTIMSYCHLTSVGIDLSLGFGPQPGQLIRTTVDSKSCLGTDCISDPEVCTYAIKKITVNYLSDSQAEVTIDDSKSSAWKYQVVPFGTDPVDNAWVDTANKVFTVSDLNPHQYYEIYTVNVCEDGSWGAGKKQILLLGGFCDGTLFTDTGGVSSPYSSNELWTKTFYPSSEGEKVKLSFTKIGLHSNVDFMYVYDGDSVNAPLFANGTITGNNNPGPVFVSTHTSGAITVKFASDANGNTYGWEATVDCSALGIEDMSDSHGIVVYPNPTADILNITSQKAVIESIQLTDVTGKVVISNQLNTLNGKINLRHLPKGVYVLTLKSDGQVITKKIMKK